MSSDATVISGRVTGGGDTTPEGLLDAPRRFVYQIETDDGSVVNLAYTAFPPSPFGDQQRHKIRLVLHGGRILLDHYIKARGSYDSRTNTLTVAQEGDFIETSPEKHQ